MFSIKPVFLSFVLFFAPLVSANEADLFSLSLHDLMMLDVTTVSKRAEPLLDAAGIVTVISQDEINAYGSKSLKDVLLRIPNFYMFDSPTFKASGTMLRAGATQHLNNHVLYLLDGRPIRESQNGGLHTDMNLLFPVEVIERIEVIRGPGSVLYGSNAFSGTINIITKKVSKEREATVKSQHGPRGYSQQTVTAGAQLNENISMQLYGSALKDDGERLFAIDEAGTKSSQTMGKDGELFSLKLEGHGFNLSVLQDEITTSAIFGAYNWDNAADFKVKRLFYDFGYQADLSSSWNISANYTTNNARRIIVGLSNNLSEFEADGYLTELTLSGELSERTNLIAGVVHDVVKGDLGIRGGNYETYRQALFTQLDYGLSDATKITAGVQWNKPEGIDSDTSPRLAIVHHYNDTWSGKLLFAKAFRSPYGSELFFDAPFLAGDENLKSESIQTSEAQLIYSQKGLSLTFSAYHSVAEDLIGRETVNNVNTFVNEQGEIQYNGYEMEWSWQINQAMRFQGNASYQENEGENNDSDVMVAANEMLKLGYTYHSKSGLVVGLWNNYLGAANKLEELSGNSTTVVNPEAEAVNLLSVNVVQNIGKLLNKSNFNGLTLELLANNILDEDVWYPELYRRQVNTFPQTHGSGVFVSLRYDH